MTGTMGGQGRNVYSNMHDSHEIGPTWAELGLDGRKLEGTITGTSTSGYVR